MANTGPEQNLDAGNGNDSNEGKELVGMLLQYDVVGQQYV